MPRAVEIALETGVIVCNALFLVLAEDSGTAMVTADTKLLNVLEGMPYTRLTHPLADVSSLIPGTG